MYRITKRPLLEWSLVSSNSDFNRIDLSYPSLKKTSLITPNMTPPKGKA